MRDASARLLPWYGTGCGTDPESPGDGGINGGTPRVYTTQAGRRRGAAARTRAGWRRNDGYVPAGLHRFVPTRGGHTAESS